MVSVHALRETPIMKSLIIDNYDSFTYNLFQMMAEVNGESPVVIKNDEFSFAEVQVLSLSFDNIVISPGPGHPEIAHDFGICKQVLTEIKKPILGICLGHQGLCCAYGGRVIHAPRPMHGRLSTVRHQNDELFHQIPLEFQVVRYHSLMSADPLPDCLEVIAWTEDNIVMALRHQSKPLWSVQFHPESICAEYGFSLLKNFKMMTEHYRNVRSILKSNDDASAPRISVRSQSNETSQRVKPLPTPTHCGIQEKYQILVKKIPQCFDPEKVFNYLLKDEEYAVWLDSNKFDQEISRFSYMGCLGGPSSYIASYDVHLKKINILKHNQWTVINHSIFEFLDAELKKYSTIESPDLPFNFIGGFIGYLGYELKCETALVKNRHQSIYPDAQFLFLDRVIVFDHLEKISYLLVIAPHNNRQLHEDWFNQTEAALYASQQFNSFILKSFSSTIAEFYLCKDRATYLRDIEACLKFIRDGDSYEICLTNKLKLKQQINPLEYYLALRSVDAAPYAAFLKFGDMSIACASIERFVKIDVRGQVETKPIKGTLPRGLTAAEDAALIHKLAHHEKFKAENLMIVDLLRNDLGKVCEIGSVHVPRLMAVESYDTVHQLVSTIRGQLVSGVNAIACIKALFPGGSMTGAPKIRTMNILDRLENEARGVYSGALGYLSLNGAADFNIVIRSAIITKDELSIGAGGAIIDLSDPVKEFEEMLLKSKSLQRALHLLHAETSVKTCLV